VVADLTSGLSWELDPDGGKLVSGGRTKRQWVRSAELPRRRALFKSPQANQPHELYSLAMERVAYRLGTTIGLRMPTVWLEEISGEHGALVERVVGRDLVYARSCPMLLNEIDDEDEWSLIVAFDIWLANTDRVDRNLFVEPLPLGKEAKYATKCRTWCVDHGFTGVFPPAKFGKSFEKCAPEDVPIGTGEMIEETGYRRPGENTGLVGEAVIREQMPDRLRQSFLALDPAARAPVLDRVRSVEDDWIDDAVGELPGAFMTGQQADLTAQLLKLRRDAIDTLVSTHW
jgi:hypothetical protein